MILHLKCLKNRHWPDALTQSELWCVSSTFCFYWLKLLVKIFNSLLKAAPKMDLLLCFGRVCVTWGCYLTVPRVKTEANCFSGTTPFISWRRTLINSSQSMQDSHSFYQRQLSRDAALSLQIPHTHQPWHLALHIYGWHFCANAIQSLLVKHAANFLPPLQAHAQKCNCRNVM